MNANFYKNTANPVELEILWYWWMFLTCSRHHYFIDIYRRLSDSGLEKIKGRKKKKAKGTNTEQTKENSRKLLSSKSTESNHSMKYLFILISSDASIYFMRCDVLYSRPFCFSFLFSLFLVVLFCYFSAYIYDAILLGSSVLTTQKP